MSNNYTLSDEIKAIKSRQDAVETRIVDVESRVFVVEKRVNVIQDTLDTISEDVDKLKNNPQIMMKIACSLLSILILILIFR